MKPDCPKITGTTAASQTTAYILIPLRALTLIATSLSLLLSTTANSATTPLYKGRPIVLVTKAQTHPDIGYSTSFGSVQFSGDGLNYIALDNQFTNAGLYYADGTAPTAIASPTLVLPSSFGTLKTVDCYCGKIRFEATPPILYQAYCHCDNCRKAIGAQVVA